MPETEIRPPAGLTTEGLLGRRYIARLIDTVISGIALVLVLWVLQRLPISPGPARLLIFLTTILAVVVGYYSMFESSAWQASPGKRIVGLQVFDHRGGRLTLVQAIGRSLAKEAPFILFGMLPQGRLIAMAWLCVHLIVLHRSPVNQAIHDRVARTWVAAPEETTRLRLSDTHREPWR